jgi:hypothetical protein
MSADKASEAAESKPGRSSNRGPHVAATLIVLALVFAGGWFARGLHDSDTERAAVRQALDDGVKHVQSALSKKNIEEAERKLAELRAVAAKDERIAELQVDLITAKIAKAVSDGQINDAKALLAKAEKEGNAKPDQIKRWQAQVEKAERATSGSGASAASSASVSAARTPPPGT